MRVSAVLTVSEYTDPACPWAWGSEPKFAGLRAGLAAAGDALAWRRVYGILFDEGEAPAPDPAAEAAWYLEEVREISGHTGAPCPQRLEWVAATSWPMALAAKAAEAQGPAVAEAVLHRLRTTTFVDGRPADTPERVLAALRELPESAAGGFDPERLARDAASAEVLAAVRRDHAETRSPCAEVFAITDRTRHPGRAKPLGEDPADGYRYALPTLVFEGPDGRAVVAGWRAAAEYQDAVKRVAPGLYELCDLGADPSR